MDLLLTNSYLFLIGTKPRRIRQHFSRITIFIATFQHKAIFQEQGTTSKNRVQNRNTDFTVLNKNLIIRVSHECFIARQFSVPQQCTPPEILPHYVLSKWIFLFFSVQYCLIACDWFSKILQELMPCIKM